MPKCKNEKVGFPGKIAFSYRNALKIILYRLEGLETGTTCPAHERKRRRLYP